jgi:hypothetical protein
VKSGIVRVPEAPGIGMEFKGNLMDLYRKTFGL